MTLTYINERPTWHGTFDGPQSKMLMCTNVYRLHTPHNKQTFRIHPFHHRCLMHYIQFMTNG